MNAREFLGTREIGIVEEIDARKEKIGEEAAWRLLADAEVIYVGRGRNFREFAPSAGNRDEILGQAMGPSGNLRAPALKVGRVFLVGFAEEMYLQHL